ncbi:tetratricopeptide repeat (TPR)-like superfamily protein [Tasmannia lanceolata]|uniref:tetratricopeptide repeat (TPR)-like superfamily protein n=1 Tax=Tasmannia lanceolata TaxID=3420 RepID=UPI0040639FC6
MASFNFSTSSEIYHPRNFNSFQNFDRCSDRSLICELWLSLSKKKIIRRTVVRCYGFCVDYRPEDPSNDCVSRIPSFSFSHCVQTCGRPNLNHFSRLKCIKITGLEGASVSVPASELVVQSEFSQVDNEMRSLGGESLILKNKSSNVVENKNAAHKVAKRRGIELWRHFPSVKREIERKASVPVPKRTEQPFVYRRNHRESVSYVDNELGVKRAIPEKASKSSSRKTGQSAVYRRNDGESVSYVDNVLEESLSAIRPESSVEHCNSLLKKLEHSGNDKTLSFFEWMRRNGKLKENITAYNLALRVLGRNGDWSRAEALLQEMTTESHCELNFQVFNTLIYACYKKGLAKQGTEWFHMMLDKEVQPNLATFGMLMSLYQKGGIVMDAEFAFGQMRSRNLHCHAAYSAMITIYTRLGWYDKSEGIINLMKEDKLVPNLENWLVQLNAYSQQGKLEEAELVLKSMQKVGISPNIIAYNTLITGYGKVGNTDAACRIFKSLQNIGLEPDETTYRSMVEGCGRANHYKEAMWYYKELKHSGFRPNSSNFYTMINLQAKHKDEEGAIQTLKDMRVMGCQYSSILGILLQAYERVERMDKVPLILKASFYDNILVDQTSCSILAMAYVQHGLLDDALRVLLDKQWTDQIFEDHLYHLLICTCKEEGSYEDAVKIFTQIPKSDSNPNLHIICSMIDIYSSLGRFNEAENLYLKLKASEIMLDMVSYSVIVRMYIKAGSLKDACLVLDMMEKHKDIVPDTFLFRDMLRIYQQCGMHEKLADVYYKILKAGIKWDEAMYNCVINCCARALPVDELSRLFNEMLQYGFAANIITLNVMLDVYGKAGLFKKARKVLWMAEKLGLADVISYNTIIAAYGQNKDFKNMRSVARKMQYVGIPISLEAYNSMLDAYGKEDQLEEFTDVMQKMKDASCVFDHYTYNIMINIYGKRGWIEEVSHVLAELKEHGLEPDLWSYNTLIKAYGIAGMVEEAVNVVKEMRENGIEPDHVTYFNLIGALQKNDNFLEAVKWSLWMKQIGMSSSKY